MLKHFESVSGRIPPGNTAARRTRGARGGRRRCLRFDYQLQTVEAAVPKFGRQVQRESGVYYRVEVFAQTGSEGYDLMGVTQQQIMEDVLVRYEAHLGFLNFSNEYDHPSLLTPPIPPATGSSV